MNDSLGILRNSLIEIKLNISLKSFFFLGILLLSPGIFAAVPIQEKSLNGAAAAEARLKLLATAESCLGVPYRYAGLDRKGLDCSGLVYLSFQEGLKYTIPRTSSSIYAWVEKINTSDLQIGDLVFFVTAGSGVSHLGIYSGDGWFIHSASEGNKTGVIYSRLDEAYWKRTYRGAGRALPWDEAAAEAMAAAVHNAKKGKAAEENAATEYFGPADSVYFADRARIWKDSGFFAGFGIAWTWGGFIEGSPSVFRGFSALAAAGYKWAKYRINLELRPELDRALGVFRLPVTFSLGNDIFQVFGGPAYTFGEPSLSLSDDERYYSGGGAWRWETGFSGAFPPIQISTGALSFYGELAWQPYHWETGEDFSFKPDITANLRFSTGLRYLWHLQK